MIVTVHKSASITEYGTTPDTTIELTRPLPTTNNLDENDALYKADATLIFDVFIEMLPRGTFGQLAVLMLQQKEKTECQS